VGVKPMEISQGQEEVMQWKKKRARRQWSRIDRKVKNKMPPTKILERRLLSDHSQIRTKIGTAN
jgi:hypothetical protein